MLLQHNIASKFIFPLLLHLFFISIFVLLDGFNLRNKFRHYLSAPLSLPYISDSDIPLILHPMSSKIRQSFCPAGRGKLSSPPLFGARNRSAIAAMALRRRLREAQLTLLQPLPLFSSPPIPLPVAGTPGQCLDTSHVLA